MPIYDFKLWFIYQINYNVRHLHVVDICLENRNSILFYNIIGPSEYLQFVQSADLPALNNRAGRGYQEFSIFFIRIARSYLTQAYFFLKLPAQRALGLT
mgnify:CR=1 FL=1